MNIVKFKDINMTVDIVEALVDTHPLKVFLADAEISTEAFCNQFNGLYRNRYAYAVNWKYILPFEATPGNPFEPDTITAGRYQSYVSYCRDESQCTVDNDRLYPFNTMKDWMDIPRTLQLMYNEHTKYTYLNEFTPDDDITIEELKQFRKWLATILLQNEPVIQEWDTEDLLRPMLTYYAQDMKDNTVALLSGFAPYMDLRSLITGTTQQTLMGLSGIRLSAGCGCTNNGGANTMLGASGTSGVVCDPLNIYRTAMYNYMVETFSNICYWTEQIEICEEMVKYIKGILKVGLPLATNVVDPYADCTCSSLDTDMDARYRKMLENLVQALEYIINNQVDGNRNFINTSFNNWATYLYEHMYWA